MKFLPIFVRPARLVALVSLVTLALDSTFDAKAESRPADLAQVLTGYNWYWEWDKHPALRIVQFGLNGKVENPEGRGLFFDWVVTGPKTFYLFIGKNPHMTYTFNDDLTRFEGYTNFHHHVIATRLGPVDRTKTTTDLSGGSRRVGSSGFEKDLLRNRWTWPGAGGAAERLFFQQGGIVVDPGHWTGQWEIKDATSRSVLIRAPFIKDSNGSATVSDMVLIFNQGMTSWSASTADGAKLSGSVDGANRVAALEADFLDITNIILSPLDKLPPGDLRDGIVRLKEGLKDEAANAPQATPKAYAAGEHLCDTLVLDLEQREAYIRRLTGGPLVPNGVPDSWAKGWAEGGVGMRKQIEAEYGQFRDSVRIAMPAK